MSKFTIFILATIWLTAGAFTTSAIADESENKLEFKDQAITPDDPYVVVKNVHAQFTENDDDEYYVFITEPALPEGDNDDGFRDARIIGYTELQEDKDGEPVLVDVEYILRENDNEVGAGDFKAHIGTRMTEDIGDTPGGTMENNTDHKLSSKPAAIFEVEGFAFNDQDFDEPTEEVVLDEVRVNYDGDGDDGDFDNYRVLFRDVEEDDGIGNEVFDFNEDNEDTTVSLSEIEKTAIISANIQVGDNGDFEYLHTLEIDEEDGLVEERVREEAEIEIFPITFSSQTIDRRNDENKLLIERVTGEEGQEVVITEPADDEDYEGAEIVGFTEFEEDVVNEAIVVDLGDDPATDYVAHIIELSDNSANQREISSNTAEQIFATTEPEPIYAVEAFVWDEDENFVETADSVTIDEIEISYEGDLGEDLISIDLYETENEVNPLGDAKGVSREDLAVNELHEDVVVDFLEPLEPELSEETKDKIYNFFARAHLGPAGEENGNRVPGEQPPMLLADLDAEELLPEVGDDNEVVIDVFERAMTFNDQALDVREGAEDNFLVVDGITARDGDALFIVDQDDDTYENNNDTAAQTLAVAEGNNYSDLEGERKIGVTLIEEALDDGSVVVEADEGVDIPAKDLFAVIAPQPSSESLDPERDFISQRTADNIMIDDKAAIYEVGAFAFNDEIYEAGDEVDEVTVEEVQVNYVGESGKWLDIEIYSVKDDEEIKIGSTVVQKETITLDNELQSIAVKLFDDEELTERTEISARAVIYDDEEENLFSSDADGEKEQIADNGLINFYSVALNTQAMNRAAGDNEIIVENITGAQGDVVFISTPSGDGSFQGETIIGDKFLEQAVDSGSVAVDVGDADPDDYVAHISQNPSGNSLSSGIVGEQTDESIISTSEAAGIYSIETFTWEDESHENPIGTVSVDEIQIDYNGSVGPSNISIDLHEVEDGEIGGFIGISQEDLGVNESHENVNIDVVEEIFPELISPQRVDDTIDETGDFFAMAHLGGAGTDDDNNRIPAQNPALLTSDNTNLIAGSGDFAEVDITGVARELAFQAQGIDLATGNTEVLVEDITAVEDDAIVITTTPDDGDFLGEEIVGVSIVDGTIQGGSVAVDIDGATGDDYVAHVVAQPSQQSLIDSEISETTLGRVQATTDPVAIYAVEEFTWNDEIYQLPTESVSVDSIMVSYEGELGSNNISVDLLEFEDGETGDYVGLSAENLPLNELHTDVEIEILESVIQEDPDPTREESTIDETGDFLASARIGSAGRNEDDQRVPGQRPALMLTEDGQMDQFAGDDAEVVIENIERTVTLGTQTIDLNEEENELVLEGVTTAEDDIIVITEYNEEGYEGASILGSATTEELDSVSVAVEIGEADPVDYVAHILRNASEESLEEDEVSEESLESVVVTSEPGAVYGLEQFVWEDESYEEPVEVVSVDVIEILYEGEIGEEILSIDLHEADGDEIGAFVGISQEDLSINEEHEDVLIDIVEAVDPEDEEPTRTDDRLLETGDFFAMAHLGEAGEDQDGNRIPAQQPALSIADDGQLVPVGDFANVEIDLIERTVELSLQALDMTEDNTEVLVEDVSAIDGEFVVLTTPGDEEGDFEGATIAGFTEVDAIENEPVLVDINDTPPADFVAHIVGGVSEETLDEGEISEETLELVEASSEAAPVYGIQEFAWDDEMFGAPAGAITVEAVEISYFGDLGEDEISLNLHAVDDEGEPGDYIGVSEVDLAVNEEHEEVAIDVLVAVEPDDEDAARELDIITETGEFAVKPYLGAAATDENEGLIPAQQPELPVQVDGEIGTISRVAEVAIEDPEAPEDYASHLSVELEELEESTGGGSAEFELREDEDGYMEMDYVITLEDLDFSLIATAGIAGNDFTEVIGLNLREDDPGDHDPVAFSVVGISDPNEAQLIATDNEDNPGISEAGDTDDPDRIIAPENDDTRVVIEGTWTREKGTAEGFSIARDGSTVTSPAQFAQAVANVQPGDPVDFSIRVHTDANPEGELSGQLVADQVTSAEDELASDTPQEFNLGDNYPNPFNPVTTISYELPETENVRLAVYDILGREVEVLVNEQQSSGTYEVSFDASDLSSGTYIYRIEAGDFSQTSKMMLVK